MSIKKKQWSTILPEVLVSSDSHNFFEIRNEDIYTHIHLISSPGGGIVSTKYRMDISVIKTSSLEQDTSIW